jgi:hypothetical protein
MCGRLSAVFCLKLLRQGLLSFITTNIASLFFAYRGWKLFKKHFSPFLRFAIGLTAMNYIAHNNLTGPEFSSGRIVSFVFKMNQPLPSNLPVCVIYSQIIIILQTVNFSRGGICQIYNPPKDSISSRLKMRDKKT